MKKILKKEIIITACIAFLMGIILASSIVVYANINANIINYTNNKTVEEALNELYTRAASNLASQTNGTATPADIIATKTAWVNGSQIIGELNKGEADYTQLITSNSYTFSQSYCKVYVSLVRMNGSDGNNRPELKRNNVTVNPIYTTDYNDTISVNGTKYAGKFNLYYYILDNVASGTQLNLAGISIITCFE